MPGMELEFCGAASAGFGDCCARAAPKQKAASAAMAAKSTMARVGILVRALIAASLIRLREARRNYFGAKAAMRETSTDRRREPQRLKPSFFRSLTARLKACPDECAKRQRRSLVDDALRTAAEQDAVLRMPILVGLAGEEARVAGPPLGVLHEYSWAGRHGACPAHRAAGHDETREDAKSCGAENWMRGWQFNCRVALISHYAPRTLDGGSQMCKLHFLLWRHS